MSKTCVVNRGPSGSVDNVKVKDPNGEGFINSELFQSVRGIPFLDSEEALNVYKGIYSPDIHNWRNGSSLNNEYITNEPTLMFRSDNGALQSTVGGVLGSSSNSYEVGFMNDDGAFKPMVKLARHSSGNIKGTVHNLISNGYLNDSQKVIDGKVYFEAVDSLSAQMIEDDYIMDYPFEFKRNELNFHYDTTTLKTDYKDLLNSYGPEVAGSIVFYDAVIDRKTDKVEKSEPLFSEQTLNNMLLGFMNKVGISLSTIEDYKKNYKTKNGVEPDAKALIDINNKIIAVANGEALITELPEEVCHFIIEAWDSNEVSKLLPYVVQTDLYKQFAEQYRDIYSKQMENASAEEIENTVRKEILGKILAQGLSDNIKNDNSYSSNVFSKMLEHLKDFIDFIKSKVNQNGGTESVNKELKFFTDNIYDMLKSNELSENLSTQDPSVTVDMMYSVDPAIDRVIKNITEDINGDEVTGTVIQDARAIFANRLGRSINAIENLKTYSKGGSNSENVVDHALTTLVDTLLSERESMDYIMSLVREHASNDSVKSEGLTNLIGVYNQTVNAMSELSGLNAVLINKDASQVMSEVAESLNMSERSKASMKYTKEDPFRDLNGVARLFGHVGKMSNPFLRLLSKIVKRINNLAKSKSKEDLDKYLAKLIPYQDKMKSFVNGSYFKSTVDESQRRIDMLKYEYGIRVKIGNLNKDELSFEEFSDTYDSDIPKIKKDSNEYYAYDYLYKKDYHKQPFANSDEAEYYNTFISNVEKASIIEGNEDASIESLKGGYNQFYALLKNWSDSRSKYSASDSLRKSEVENTNISRRTMSNIFRPDGTLKKGLSYIRLSEAKHLISEKKITKEDVVSTNPSAIIFDKGSDVKDSDFVVVYRQGDYTIDDVKDGSLAFQLLKWNNLSLSGEKNLANMNANLKKQFDSNMKNEWSKIEDDVIRNKAICDWLYNNIQFSIDDSYWDKSEPVNYEELRNKMGSNEKAKQDLYRKEKDLAKAMIFRSNILKIYRNTNDFREIDASKISIDDKLALENAEKDITNKRAELRLLFEEFDVEMYKGKEDRILPSFNNSFYKVFKDKTGVDYDKSTFAQKRTFFSGPDGMSADKFQSFLVFSRLIGSTQKEGSGSFDRIKRYKDMVEDPTDLDSVREAYFRENSPVWYKRYDTDPNYKSFIKDFTNGKVDGVKLMDDYFKGVKFKYNDSVIKDMSITPSFKYSLEPKESIEDLYKDYKNSTDEKEKYELLEKMAGIDKMKNSYLKMDMSSILGNQDNLKIYIDMMDMHLVNLEKKNALKDRNIFLRPQMRKTNLERTGDTLMKQDRKTQVSDWFNESVQNREDDMVDYYKSSSIPKKGLYRLKDDEITNDILGSLAWDNYESNLYEQRTNNYSIALKSLRGLESSEFTNGKKATETNTYHVAKEMLDYNFFGKTTTMKIETTILGKKIDFAKILLAFRNFSTKMALSLSPIVSVTNVLSGLTQHAIIKWVGKNIYSPADDRATKMVAGMLASSIKDVGSISPSSKMNKLLYSFGIYNSAERFKNSDLSAPIRLLPETFFAGMSVGNFGMQSRVLMSKLMEIRLVDGEFKTWRSFSISEKLNNPNITKSELRDKFNSFEENSMYDYLDDNGDFNTKALEKDGYKGNIELDKADAMAKIQDIAEQVTMEMQSHNQGSGARSPLWSFVLGLKKWMIMSSTSMFSKRRFDDDSDAEEEGLIYGFRDMFNVGLKLIKEGKSLSDSYKDLDEVSQKNMRTITMSSMAIAGSYIIASMLKGAADDDDEKDNYALQLSTYLALRNLNEVFSGNIGIGNSYYEALQSPIMTLGTVKNLAGALNVSKIGETVSRGKYKDMDKYVAGLVKLTWAKNLYAVKDAETIGETRRGYEFFTAQNAMYHILTLLEKDKDDENEK